MPQQQQHAQFHIKFRPLSTTDVHENNSKTFEIHITIFPDLHDPRYQCCQSGCVQHEVVVGVGGGGAGAGGCRRGPRVRGHGAEAAVPAAQPHPARPLLHQQLQPGRGHQDQPRGHPQPHPVSSHRLRHHQHRQLVPLAPRIPRLLLQIRTLPRR